MRQRSSEAEAIEALRYCHLAWDCSQEGTGDRVGTIAGKGVPLRVSVSCSKFTCCQSVQLFVVVF